jgi:hypothetical protein
MSKGFDMNKDVLVIFLISFVVSLAACKKDESTGPPPNPNPTPTYNLTDFERAQSCSTCHPQYYKEWEGSMHLYSTADPIWRLANNSLHQATNGTLGKACFQCHSPVGFITGTTVSPFEFSDLDPFVREGITCDFCHVMRPPYKTTNQRVEYNLAPGRVKYGTLENPVATSAHEHGYDASYDRSEVCRPCHDLILNNVPFEITNTEWQNSPWGGMSVECQHCHMKTYTGRAVPGGPIRNNLHRHSFVGVDVAITDFPNKAEQKAEIDSLLKNSATVTVNVPTMAALQDSIRLAICIYNDKTGHNLPTSVFFNRQMWLEVTVWKGSDTVYRSGHLDANGDLMDKNSVLRPNEDKDLQIFNGTLYSKGQETGILVYLDSIVNKTIKPFECRNVHYKFKIPRTGFWNARVRLLFRPFGPYLFRNLGAHEYITELPIFEMSNHESLIEVR